MLTDFGTTRTKYCFVYCGDDVCNCGLANEYGLDLIDLIIGERVAPAAQEIRDENESVSPAQSLEQDVAPAKGRS